MRGPLCTKCNGTGSEGYISFLRCGRCSGSGDEPRDSLIPYSSELIVMADGPVLTGVGDAAYVTTTNVETISKAIEDEAHNRMVEEKAAAACVRRKPRFNGYGYSIGYNRQPGAWQGCSPEGIEKKKEPLLHRTRCIEFDTGPDVLMDIPVDLDFIWNAESPDQAKAILKKVLFETKYKYLIEMYYSGYPMIKDFYTGLGLPAMMDCPLNYYSERKVTFTLTCIERPDVQMFYKERLIVTLMFEFHVEKSSLYQYPMGNYPTYGKR